MWTCDVVPWVSGWTIAFITWIYDNLIDSLSSFNITNLKLLLRWDFSLFWKKINWKFLLLVFAGVFTAILGLAKIITNLLETYPVGVRAFFLGLILASALLLKKNIKKRTINLLLLFIGWIVLWYLISTMNSFAVWGWYSTIFFSWFIAIIAMILPGISWSYILVVLGQYQNIIWQLEGLIDWNLEFLPFVLVFVLWCIIGLLAFSRFLNYLKNNRHDQMVAVLIWFILWSLSKVWPRKDTASIVDWSSFPKNIVPQSSSDLILWMSFIVVGFFVVWWVYQVSKNIQNIKK